MSVLLSDTNVQNTSLWTAEIKIDFGNTLIPNQLHLSKSTGRSISVQVAGSIITIAQSTNLESFVGRVPVFYCFS